MVSYPYFHSFHCFTFFSFLKNIFLIFFASVMVTQSCVQVTYSQSSSPEGFSHLLILKDDFCQVWNSS